MAEARPFVMHHCTLLSAVFGIDIGLWRNIPAVGADLCDPHLLAKYRQRFPQLWHHHDLVLKTMAAPLSNPEPDPAAAIEQSESGCLFTLFVAGQSPKAGVALMHLHQALQQSRQPYTLKVVDIQKHPDQAVAHRVTDTPTLMQLHPAPVKRLTGQLTNTAQIVDWLKSPL